MNLCEAQWLAYAFPYRRFAVALAGYRARLRVDADRYSFIVSDLHRLLLAGLSGALRNFPYVIWIIDARKGSHSGNRAAVVQSIIRIDAEHRETRRWISSPRPYSRVPE
jgi:hypothetical protein